MTAILPILPTDVTPAEAHALDTAITAGGDHFIVEFVGDGWAVDCSGCGPHVVDTIDDAITLMQAHTDRHDREATEVWV